MLSDGVLLIYCIYFWGMQKKRYQTLIYFIAATIVATIAIQLYWNAQNYKVNKQRLINEVQISLDNGVEAYYADLAKTDFFSFVGDPITSSDLHGVSVGGYWSTSGHDTVFRTLEADSLRIEGHGNAVWSSAAIDSIFTDIESDTLKIKKKIKGFTQFIDSGRGITAFKPDQISSVSILRGKAAADSIQGLQNFATKLVVSIIRDSLEFDKLNPYFEDELSRKNISLDYKMVQLNYSGGVVVASNERGDEDFQLTTFSNSAYLPNRGQLKLFFSNPTLAILKRSMTGIILSFFLSASIIACLLYLLRVINKQKELAEIKNDLISNITHEFKTPIATVSTAIEGIKNFNETNDKVKTDKYLDISDQQLKKLHQMVEKLLETATLDSDKLLLNREEIDLVMMLRGLTEKYQMLTNEKTLNFTANVDALPLAIDPFHFENAIANLIDNAVKYGGDTIEVNLTSMLNAVEITVADNGGNIDKSQREKIFDKFYRIPTGNRHDVKGFGIGLFYTKKIVEKHNGTITLTPDAKNTVFKVTL